MLTGIGVGLFYRPVDTAIMLVATILMMSRGVTSELFHFRSGDIIIGGLAVVHNNEKMVGGTQLIEIINMMVEEINKNTTVLPGINLGSLIIDTRRTSSHTLKQIVERFFPLIPQETRICTNESMFKSLPLFAGIIGSSTSGVSMDSAKLLQGYHIPQISYWSTSLELSDKKMYPYFFRTIPPDAAQIEAIVEFARRMEWNYVSFVYEDSAYGISGLEAFMKHAGNKGICVAAAIRLSKIPSSTEIENATKMLKEKRRARAVVLFVLSSAVKMIMTNAKSDAEVAGHFVWLVTDTTVGILPVNAFGLEKYETELRDSIGFAPTSSHKPRIDEYFMNLSIKDRTNSTLNPWLSKYISIMNNCSISTLPETSGLRKCSTDEKIYPAKYKQYVRTENVANAFLMFTHALDQIHKEICSGVRGICPDLEKMKGTSALAKLTYRALRQINITGINGLPFKFDENQDPPRHYSIYTYGRAPSQNDSSPWQMVGQLNGENFNITADTLFRLKPYRSTCSEECKSNEIKLTSDSNACCWICKKCGPNEYIINSSSCVSCPVHWRPNSELNGCEEKELRYFGFEISYSTAPLAAGLVGMLLSIFVTAIFLKFRNSPIVKSSGKELCFYALFGIALCFTNSFAIIGKPPTNSTCTTACLLIAIGPTIMYAALVAKTIRVVIIFRSKILSARMKRFLLPQTLLLFTSILIVPQIIIVSIWLAVFPTGPVLIEHEFSRTVYQTCNFLNTPEIAIGFMYPFLLTIVCTVLATINRNVPTGFNEAKLIGFSAYATIVVWLSFAVTFGANQSNSQLKVTIVSLCVSFNAYAVLICLFAPRCFSMVWTPEKNTKEAVMDSNTEGQRRSNVSTGFSSPSTAKECK